MAKQRRRAQITRDKNQQGHYVEEVFDDNLLPDAAEIRQLHELDPNIIEWLKSRAEKEQNFRHDVYIKRVNLVAKTEKGLRWINYLGLFFSFLLLAGGMYLSYFLIEHDHQVVGTIFTGVTLIAIASLFMSKVKSNNGEKTKK
ncbi:hypothetical protein SAMN05216480_10555 [Pustulibacterium marinum]|uniref:DUF2335 domain-containing protein n=1 Tax=Pustulibacterium marinum TaxID=1224947 RepID=A0A1I7GL63_9FLAO|nr:hypothetical protein [Pustulibacterium marinum]SFU49232.1 hypothetical protein SAMN05216480_10555 [Pustulibacterium marinum]